MAYDIALQSGEELLTRINFRVSDKQRPFDFAITNQAIYIPRIKLIAKTDPFYFQRVPISQVRLLNVRRQPAYVAWVVGTLMFLFGAFGTYSLFEPVFHPIPDLGVHHVSGWPPAIMIGGLLMPIVSRGRFGLEVWLQGGKFRWKPPLVLDGASKTKIAETMNAIVEAGKRPGIQISDSRQGKH